MLSIVLPCFNPPKNWELNVIQSIKSISEIIPHEKIELIIVNDGTTQNEFIHQYKAIQKEFKQFNLSITFITWEKVMPLEPAFKPVLAILSSIQILISLTPQRVFLKFITQFQTNSMLQLE